METWRPVAGYESDYSISNFGRVRRETSRTRAKAGSILKLTPSRDRYLTVNLSKPGHKSRTFFVHRLVWEAHRGLIPKTHVVNHENGVRGDNRLANLSLLTTRENIQHAYDVLGRRATNTKITEADAVAIREARAQGESYKDIAPRFGITDVAALSIATGRTWKHAGGPIASRRQVDVPVSADVVEAVRGRVARGERVADIATELGVTRRTIYNWTGRRTRE